MKPACVIPLGALAAALTLGLILAAGSQGAPAAVKRGVYIPPKTRVTTQMQGARCSVTEYGPKFPYDSGGWRVSYGGSVSCAQASLRKTLRVSVQVRGADGRRWFTIRGSSLSRRSTSVNSLRLHGTRRAYLGHVYRIVAVGWVKLSDGRTLSAIARGKGWAP